MVNNEHMQPSLPQVMSAVGLLYRRAVRALDDVTGEIGVGTRTVLEVLAQTDPQPVPAIAKTLELSRQFVQRSVDEGMAAGLLELSENPAHRRSRIVSITPTGRALLESIAQREEKLFAPVADQLSDDDVATCLRVLRTVYESTDWTAKREGSRNSANRR